MISLPENPQAPTATRAKGDELIVLAICIPRPPGVAENMTTEFCGAELLQRCLTSALHERGVLFNSPAIICPALHNAVFGCWVQDVGAALAALRAEAEQYAFAVVTVIGVFDRREDYFRTLWPASPAFDLNARMKTALPMEPLSKLGEDYLLPLTDVHRIKALVIEQQAALLARLAKSPENPS